MATTMDTKPLRLAVVDNQTLFRRGFVDLVKNWPRGSVAVQAANGREYEQACNTAPRIDIAVVELHMPVRNGFETISYINRNQSRTKALAHTTYPKSEEVVRVLQLGGRGILCKTVDEEEMLRAMDHLARTGFYYNELVDKRLRQKVEEDLPGINAILASITPREMEFLLLYAKAPFPSLLEVAERMVLSENGVEDLRKKVADRLGCRKREQMMQFVFQQGL